MDAATDQPARGEPLLRFTPTIELGHLIQVMAMLLMIGGWALVGYQAIQKELDQHAAQMKLFEQRLVADEAAMVEQRENLRNAVTETRQQLSKISDQLGDLRTLVAQQRADGPRR